MRGKKKHTTVKKGRKTMPPYYRTSVTMPDSIAKEINKRRGLESFSRHIVNDLSAYWEAVDLGMVSLRQKLTKNESRFILDAMESCGWMTAKLDENSLTRLVEIINTTPLKSGLKTDPNQLIKKIETLSRVELIALLNWSRTDQQKEKAAEEPVEAHKE